MRAYCKLVGHPMIIIIMIIMIIRNYSFILILYSLKR